MKVTITERQLKSMVKRALSEDDGTKLINKMLGWSKDGLTDNPVEKATDEPEKADTIGTDVKTYFKILADVNEPLKQQKYGTMKWQQGVEATQIGLIMLGYELPKHGVDGLFGPETAAAVNKFKKDNDVVNENFRININEAELVQLKDTSYSNVKYDNDGTGNDYVNVHLLNDLQAAAVAADIVITITTAKKGHDFFAKSGNVSRHTRNVGVDIALLNGIGSGKASNAKNGNPEFRKLGYQLADALKNIGYDCCSSESGNEKAILWQTNTGGNHFNHLHVSNTKGVSKEEQEILKRTKPGKVPEGMVADISLATASADLIKRASGSGEATPTSGPASSSVDTDQDTPASSPSMGGGDIKMKSNDEQKDMATITPDMVDKMIEKLMDKGVTSDDLKDLVDPAKISGGGVDFTDLDLNTTEGEQAYTKICDNFINTRNPGGPVTGMMLTKGAKLALKNYQKYIPPELALAQITLEGGLSKDDGEKRGNEKDNKLNRPNRTKNPFNVGNTKRKDREFPTYQDGIDAYYTLVARRYMVNKKTAADLIRDFKNVDGNEYSGDYSGDYEKDLAKLVLSIRRKNENIYKSLA